MPSIKVYKQTGEEAGTLTLDRDKNKNKQRKGGYRR